MVNTELQKSFISKGRVLVVDDLPDVRTTLSGFLSDEGYNVRSVSSRVDALRTVDAKRFSVAVLDVRLDETDEDNRDGLLLMHEIKEISPDTTVIVLTGYADVKMVREALQPDNEGIAPAFGFLEKSEMEQLPEYVARAFEHAGNDSRLSLSFAMGQPLKARSRGRHTRSIYTLKTLQVSVDRYAKRAKDAMRDPNNLRFQVGGIGRDLWRELFLEHPKVERTYIEARAKSRYLSLVFETPREFLRLPLEFVRSENPPEYLVIQHPLARFLYNANPMRKAISPSMLAQTKSLRILIVASNTKPLIDGVDTEVQELSKYLKSQTFIHVDVTLIPTERAAYERVRTELRKQDYDILHYAGHGSYRSDSPEESCLYFWANENREGDIVEMRADELKILFGDSNARLVYLSSCYGTATGAREKLLDDDFLGLADVVSQAGVPSVLGFRWPVSDDGAVKMSLAFYRSLLKQGSPEIALWRARRELAAWNRNDTTWLSPILIHQI